MLRFSMKMFKPHYSAGRTAAAAASFAALLFAATAPAQAQLVINADFGNSITSDPNHVAIEAAINAAIAVYTSKITNPITVSMAFGEGGGLGENTTFFGTVSYSSYLAQLNSHAFSAADATSLAVLNPEGNTVNPVNGATTIAAKLPDLRALGYSGTAAPGGQSFDGLTGAWDGTILLNTALTTPGSAGSSLQYNLQSVAEHEMDEVLGLGSGLDGGGSPVFAQDLFRYSSTAGVRNYTTAGDNAFFSIDGVNDLTQFNQSGGGADYGDWHSSAVPQVQDAFGTPGSAPQFGTNEQLALDVIGYNFKPTGPAATPEPGSMALFAGLSVTGAAFLRRRKHTKKVA